MVNVLADQRVLLIGGAGFIGHNLALKLKSVNANVCIIDSLGVNNLLAFNSGENTFINQWNRSVIQERLELLRNKEISLLINDACDTQAICEQMKQFQPTVIIHLAGVAHVDRANNDPQGSFRHNMVSLQNTLNCAKNFNAHFIFFSSSTVYGNFKTPIVTEETLCEPLGIYAAHKFGGEKLVIAYHQVFNMPYTIVRPSGLYGERCVSRRVVQRLIESALRNEEFVIQGDGSAQVDFTYIEDLLQGIIHIVQNPKSRNQTFNLTYGQARSVNELIEELCKYFPDIRVRHVKRDNLFPERGTLSVDKARQMVNYEPQYPLEKGMSHYISWYRGANFQ